MLDCIIRGGAVIDGTGAPGILADVGIHNGRIASLGKPGSLGKARSSIDANGLVVAPGFVDAHTHYDAQVMWDPGLTPSSLHGVTTVLGGNCGFTIAPVNASSADYVMRMLACVEAMPVAALEAALEFRWNTFGEWLDQLEGRVALNVGFSVGHSTIRRMVMGEDWRRAASEAEVAAMAREVDVALRAGALGFSSSWGDVHSDHQGNPVPSRFASREELIALATVLRGRTCTMLEFIPGNQPVFRDTAVELMADMSAASGRPLNWNAITVGTGVDWASNQARMAIADRAAARGGRVTGLTLPLPQPIWLDINSLAFNGLPGWPEVTSLPHDERQRALADPTVRAKLAKGVVGNEGRSFYNFTAMLVDTVHEAQLKPLEGRALGDIAAERGCSALEAFLDTVVADKARARFVTGNCGDDAESWKQRAKIWNDPRVLVGGSDAGAHVDVFACYGFFTDFIGPNVRDRKLISLEDAVHKITDMPARFFGLKERGRLAAGWHADITVFDPATVCTNKVGMRADMPAGQSRLYADATGIAHVLVNGVEITTRGQLTGALPGTVLRSGRDTRDDT